MNVSIYQSRFLTEPNNSLKIIQDFIFPKEKDSVIIVIVCGCFISTVRWKIQPFFQFSPWRDPRLRHFSGYPFGTSRKKQQPFSITRSRKNIYRSPSIFTYAPSSQQGFDKVKSFRWRGVGFGEGRGPLFQKGASPLPNLQFPSFPTPSSHSPNAARARSAYHCLRSFFFTRTSGSGMSPKCTLDG